MIRIAQDAVRGMTMPFVASFYILRRKDLLLLSLLPLVLALGVYGFAVSELSDWSTQLFDSFWANRGWETTGFLYGISKGFLWIATWLVAIFTFSYAATLIASPFNDTLSERTEKTLNTLPVRAGGNAFTHFAHVFFLDLLKTGVALMLGIFAMLISWIPIVNFIGFGLGFALVAFQFVTYPQTRRGLNVRQSLRFLMERPALNIGFGMVIATLLSIPILGCFFIPAAVVGGTLLYVNANDANTRTP